MLGGVAARVPLLAARVNADEALVRRGRVLVTSFLLGIGTEEFLLRIVDGRIADVREGPFVTPSWVFAIHADAPAWERFCRPLPAPGDNDILALLRRRELRLSGNLQPLMAHLLYFKGLFACLRSGGGEP